MNPPGNDKKFVISMRNMPPEFYRGAVEVGAERHLIFASEEQLVLLARLKRWFLDGTFKIVLKPFMQLFTISGFIRVSGNSNYY